MQIQGELGRNKRRKTKLNLYARKRQKRKKESENITNNKRLDSTEKQVEIDHDNY